MSKRRSRHRRQKSRPSAQPSLGPSRAPRRRPPVRTGEREIHTGRRKFLKILGLGGAGLGVAAAGAAAEWRWNILGLFNRSKQPQAKEQVRDPEWIDKIELPQTQIEDEPLKWPQEEKEKYFYPPDVDRDHLQRFLELFNLYKEVTKVNFRSTRNPKARYAMAAEFITRVMPQYLLAVGNQENRNFVWGSDELLNIIKGVNQLLVPHGFFVKHEIDPSVNDLDNPDEAIKFAIYRVENLHNLHINEQGTVVTLPIVFISKDSDLVVGPNMEPIELNGEYQKEGRYIVIDKQTAISQGYDMIESTNRRLGGCTG